MIDFSCNFNSQSRSYLALDMAEGILEKIFEVVEARINSTLLTPVKKEMSKRQCS